MANHLTDETMYKHILIPTDGSKLAETAVREGIAFARAIKAKVTGFTAMPEYQVPSESELMTRTGISMREHEKRAKKKAEALLKKLEVQARRAGVECDTAFALNDRPYEAIIRAAETRGCDLIFIASHGRRGLSALLHGSQTQGVLSRSRIPTLVYR